MKRDSNSDDGSENKRNRRNDDVVRLLIPSRIAGAVIGKGGQHIQKMRSQYKATVSVDDCQGPERTILISSDLDSVCSIIGEMLKYFEERDDEFDVRMLIHQSLAGCVIGKGGAKIKEIRDKIGCRILKVFSNVAPQSTDRIVQIIGKQDQCVEAVREVVNLTRDTPIKGAVHNYDPINFDDVYADDYGGYGNAQNGGGGGAGAAGAGNFRAGNERQSRMPDRRGGRDGFGGGGDRGGRREDRSRSRGGGRNEREYINPWANPTMPLTGGNAGPFGGGAGGFGGAGNAGSFGGGFGSGGGGNFGAGNSVGGFGTGGGGGGNGGNFGGGGFGNAGGSSGGGFGGGSGGGAFGGTGPGFGNTLGNNSLVGNGLGGGNMGGGGGGNMGNSGPGGGFGGGGGMNGNNDGKNSTQVTIPKDLAGAIIGKGGVRIRRIRNESGAYITIDEPLPGSNDRIITISGNPKQIQMAQYLLQQSVHENRRGNKF